jgi:hypothetical protein
MPNLGKQLINITEWNDHEVRVEIFGNGNYIPKSQVAKWIRDNASSIASEVSSNIEVRNESE